MSKNPNLSLELQLDEVKAGIQSILIAKRSPSTLESDPNYKKNFIDKFGDGVELVSCEPFYKHSDIKRGKNTKNDIPAGYVIVSKNAEGKQTITVSYHGTRGNNLQEIKHDLQATQTKRTLGTGKKISLHSGFNAEFEDSKSDLDEKLKLALSKAEGAKINFTGHSLGGAVATIAALHYCTNEDSKVTPEAVKLITFGAPRVLQKDSVGIFNETLGDEKAIRIEIANDIIPRVPPETLGYKHVGFQINIGYVGHAVVKYNSALETQNTEERNFKFMSSDIYASKILSMTKEAFAKLISSSKNLASSIRTSFKSNPKSIHGNLSLKPTGQLPSTRDSRI